MNSTLYLDRKIIVFESDDWGLQGMRDLEAFERLKTKGYKLGQRDCDCYSLELPEDLEALYRVLSKHSDSFGLPPIFTCNFVVSKPDYEKIAETGFQEFHVLDLSQGVPDLWKNRDRLLNVYKEGIKQGLVYPGYHGLCHFRYDAWLKALQDGESDLLDCFREHVSFIFSMRGDSFNYEYLESVNPIIFLSLSKQEEIIKKGVGIFNKIFGFSPVVTTAPRCAWNCDTEKAWHKNGIRYISAGNRRKTATSLSDHRLGERNLWDMIYLIRNVNFEPIRDNACIDAFIEIDFLFKVKQPAILETHSINFFSSIKNFREKSLERLDQLLYLIEEKYPDVVYLSSQQFGDILEKGYCLLRNGERMDVKISRTSLPYLGKFYFSKKKVALKRFYEEKSALWLNRL